MKKWLVVLSVIGCLSAFGRDVQWREDYELALAESKETSLPVFILFTNTKSCGYCIESDSQIFSNNYFKQFAKKEVVPLKVDYAPLFGNEKKATWDDMDELRARYKIPPEMKSKNWPYVVLVASDGTGLYESSERDASGARDFVKKFEKIIEEK